MYVSHNINYQRKQWLATICSIQPSGFTIGWSIEIVCVSKLCFSNHVLLSISSTLLYDISYSKKARDVRGCASWLVRWIRSLIGAQQEHPIFHCQRASYSSLLKSPVLCSHPLNYCLHWEIFSREYYSFDISIYTVYIYIYIHRYKYVYVFIHMYMYINICLLCIPLYICVLNMYVY